MNTGVGLAGKVTSVMNVFHTLAVNTARAKLRGSATVMKDGADSSAIKVLLAAYQTCFFVFLIFLLLC